MDFMSQLLMERFNPLGARPIVYNTYQMYMVGAGDRVRRDLDYAQQRGYTFAAKVVRGAYLVGEVQNHLLIGQNHLLIGHIDLQHSTQIRGVQCHVAPAPPLFPPLPLVLCSADTGGHIMGLGFTMPCGDSPL